MEHVYCACPSESEKLCKTEKKIIQLVGRVMRLFNWLTGIGNFLFLFNKYLNLEFCTGNGRVKRKKFLESKHINVAPKKSYLICPYLELEK